MKVAKEHKDEVKYWRKELGEETTTKIKLKQRLYALENGIETKPTLAGPRKKISPKNYKSETDSNSAKILQDETLCSMCSVCIQGYVPEYFLGERFNAACESCKSMDSSWTLDQLDPFSSFAESSMPSSLASHWLPVKYDSVQDPGSISSLVTHFVQLPSPGDQFITAEEAIKHIQKSVEQMFEKSFEKWFR